MNVVTSTIVRTFHLLRQAVFPSPFPGLLRYFRRLLAMILFLPLFLLLQAIHWIGFAVDEILFRGYRRVAVERPVFVLGVPRSGTTFMHRLLAEHDCFATFSTWECLLAPSISERYLYRGFGRLDSALGRPVRRAAGWLGRRLLGPIDDVHPMSLDAPEEDYLALLPVYSAFILVLPFPGADWLWRLGRFDADAEPGERQRLLRWYRRCLQKHLYVHGPEKTLLSKNASFGGMAESLIEEFPDCRLVICERDSLAAIRSQLNSLSFGMQLFAIPENDEYFIHNLLNCIDFYYQNLDRVWSRLGRDRARRVPLWTLSEDPRAVMGELADLLDLGRSASLDASLSRYEAGKTERRESATLLDALSARGLDPVSLQQRFAAWRHEEGLRI